MEITKEQLLSLYKSAKALKRLQAGQEPQKWSSFTAPARDPQNEIGSGELNLDVQFGPNGTPSPVQIENQELSDYQKEFLEERIAIMIFDGLLPEQEAKQKALTLAKKWRPLA